MILTLNITKIAIVTAKLTTLAQVTLTTRKMKMNVRVKGHDF